jgi:hypothetical protein
MDVSVASVILIVDGMRDAARLQGVVVGPRCAQAHRRFRTDRVGAAQPVRHHAIVRAAMISLRNILGCGTFLS